MSLRSILANLDGTIKNKDAVQVEEKKAGSPEEELIKFSESVLTVKNTALELQIAYITKLLEYEELQKKLLELKQELPKAEDAQLTATANWKNLIEEANETIQNDNQTAATISLGLDESSLANAQEIFKLNVPRLDYIEKQTREIQAAEKIVTQTKENALNRAEEKESTYALNSDQAGYGFWSIDPKYRTAAEEMIRSTVSTVSTALSYIKK